MMDFTCLFPGFSPDAPKAPEPLPAPVTREDPAAVAARKKLRFSEKNRKGRSASILTGGLGVANKPGVIKRPGATDASNPVLG